MGVGEVLCLPQGTLLCVVVPTLCQALGWGLYRVTSLSPPTGLLIGSVLCQFFR